MSFSFKCPYCGAVLQAEDSWSGQQTTCPTCSQQITIPAQEPIASQYGAVSTVDQTTQPVNLGMATGALICGILSFLLVPFCGILALILGIIALSKIKHSNGMLLGHGKAVTGIIFGVWSIVRFPVIAILAAMLLPALSKARDKAREIACVSNLKQITLAIVMYENDNNGRLPSIEALPILKEYVGDDKTMQCPSGGEYIFFVNGAKDDLIQRPSRTVLAICPNHHPSGRAVGFADGHVETVSEENLNQALEECPAGKLPVLNY